MEQRRRFLKVLGAATASMALPACGSSTDSVSDTGGSDGATSTGDGSGGGSATSTSGTGGGGGATSSSTVTSSTSGAGGAGGGGCQDPPGNAVGAPGDYITDGLHIVPGSKVLIGRDAGGLYALTSDCPHQHCDMDEMSQGKALGTILANGGIKCNCHGSKFDAVGNVTQGPALKALKAYALALGCDGLLYVDRNTVVPNTDRLDA